MATFTVTTLADENDAGATDGAPGGAGLSLREAIGLANADGTPDTIVFEAGLSGTIRLVSGTLTITNQLTIDGDMNGDNKADIKITGDAAGNDTLSGGLTDIAASDAAGTLGDNVRIIQSSATLKLDSLTLTGGVAATGDGGAVDTANTNLTIDHSTLAGNRAAGRGGAAFGNDVTIAASTLSGNVANTGGGAEADDDLTATNSTIAFNRAAYDGGGLRGYGVYAKHATVTGNVAAGYGAGISGQYVDLTNSIVTGNAAPSFADYRAFGGVSKGGGNIIGSGVFSDFTSLGSTGAAAVFAQTIDIGGGILAGVLADNGGWVRTVALNTSVANPAIDAANRFITATDSRGVARYDNPGVANGTGGGADLGAFEATAPAVAVDDAFTVQETGTLAGNVLNPNPTTADSGAPLAVAAVNGSAANVGGQIALASGALLTLNADGTFAYDPNHAFDATPDFATSGASNATATDNFTYTLSGGGTATVTVSVRGVDSDDTLTGTAGADTLRGGIGDDTYVNPTAADTIVEVAGAGGGLHDTIRSAASYNLRGAPNVEDVVLSGAGNTNAMGNNFANILTGNGGRNQLNAGGGADTLDGGTGHDKLDGGNGADTLIGGAGNDTMDGGAGADLFKFATVGTGGDRINNFQVAVDRFDLDGGTFTDLNFSNGDTVLRHDGGTIRIVGITSLTLSEWRDLIINFSREAPDGHADTLHTGRFAAPDVDPAVHFAAHADFLFG